MLFQGLQYINFLFQSKNQHGVHSPFVYDFVTKCLYKKSDMLLINAFKKIKKLLFSNLNFIEVRDFGSGSKLFKSNKRQISKIAKIAGISNKKVKILTKIITYFKPNTILEIGTSVGLSTSVFKISNRNANITTLEGCIETSSIAKDIFKNNNFKNIEILVGNFKNTLPKATERNEFDCIFFDGNHTKKATLNYFQECLKTVSILIYLNVKSFCVF